MVKTAQNQIPYLHPQAILTVVGSVKAPIVEALKLSGPILSAGIPWRVKPSKGYLRPNATYLSIASMS